MDNLRYEFKPNVEAAAKKLWSYFKFCEDIACKYVSSTTLYILVM